MTPTAQMSLVNPTDYKIYFIESYNNMSMSRESRSVKKSSKDCLKLAKQWYSILSEMMLFLNYRIFSGSEEALVRCGGKL